MDYPHSCSPLRSIRLSVALWIMRFKGPRAVVAARVPGVQGYIRNLGRIRCLCVQRTSTGSFQKHRYEDKTSPANFL
jgi:hypothetical protein